MAAFNDRKAGNKQDENIEDGHLIAGAFDYTEEVESPFMESQFENLDAHTEKLDADTEKLDADTEKLDIPYFVGDLQAIMVDDSDDEVVLDSDDEVVLDSDDEVISVQNEGKIRGGLWRRASAVGTQSLEVRSSAGSNLTEKVAHGDTHHQEVLVERSRERESISNNKNAANVDHDTDTKSSKGDEFHNSKVTFTNINTANGAMNESQEPGEAAEAKALDFVDHFLSVSAISSSPEARIPRTDWLRSPLVCSAKGSQNLAMKTNIMNQVGVSTFDWDNDQPDHGGDFFSKKKKELDIQKERDFCGRHKEGFQESVLVYSKRTFSSSVAQNINIKEPGEKERDAFRVNEFDEELLKEQPGNASNERDAPDMFDVGFDTQMAAEAMETLLYAAPPPVIPNDHEGLKISKQYSSPSTDNCDSRTNDISCNQTRFVNPSHQMSASFNKNERGLHLELPHIGKPPTENCVYGNNRGESKKRSYKSFSKVSRKKQKEDSDKENIGNGLVKTNKGESVGRMQQEVKTFSPVACRTRHASSIKHSKRTDDAACNLRSVRHFKQVDVCGKRKTGDLDTDFLLGKRIECFTWKWPKKKRTRRNTRQNAKLTSTFDVASSVIGTGKGNSVVGPIQTKLNFLTLNVNKKTRSACRYRSMSGKKLLMQKFGQPSLVDVKAIPMNLNMTPEVVHESVKSHSRNPIDMGSIPSLGGEKKIKDVPLNRKSSSESNQDDVGPPVSVEIRKQPHKKSSTSSSLQNELSRLGFTESLPDSISKDLRRCKSKVEIRVLFSQSLDGDAIKQQRKIVKKLGISLATDCSDATHLVADRFARTKKMFQAIAFGKSVVTPSWLESCEQARCIVDHKNYILRDAKKEKEIGFSMPVSLSHARTDPLLKDRRVLITSNVEPNREMVEILVKAVQGQVMESIQQASMDHNISDNLLILSCEKDYEACVPFLDKGATVYGSELLLNGIIIQKLEYSKHQLFNDHVKMKRYARKRKKNKSQHRDHCG